MTSTSLLGASTVVLQFDLNRNIDAAARDVQAAINAARSQLPQNLPNNPSYRKVNPADAPIMILALTSDIMPVGRLYDAADSILAQKLSQVEGVGQVFVGGGAKPAVRVQVDPGQLSALGYGLEEVRAGLGRVNANSPKGELSGPTTAWAINATDQLFDADQYRPVIVAYQKGAPIRLGDVATVVSSVEDVRTGGLADGKRAVVLVLFRQPGANMIETVDRVYDLLPTLRASIPPSIRLAVALDRTTSIRAAFKDVQISLLISVVLVVLVVFVFLRSVSATIIPSVAVPLSLVGTFGGMYLCGYSLDNLSLMALTISTGFVVDDAIVVLENITRYVEEGERPLAAAFRGAREIGFTVLSMTLSLVSVFIPILLMGGLVGRLFREFAVTLTIAVTISLLVSLSVTPMMCSRFLRSERAAGHGRLYRFGERAFDGLTGVYDRTLRWVLRHRRFTMVVTLATICLNVYLYTIVPKGFFPQQDVGRIVGSIQAEQDISSTGHARQDAGVRQHGDGRSRREQRGCLLRRHGQSHEYRAHVRRAQAVGGAQALRRPRDPAAARKARPRAGGDPLPAGGAGRAGGGRMSNAQYQYTLQSTDLNELNAFAPRMLAKLRTVEGLRDVATDQQNRGLQASLVIDRDTASRLGILPQLIDDTLYDAFGQRQVSNIYTPLNQYHVILEVPPAYQQNPDAPQVDLRQVRARAARCRCPPSPTSPRGRRRSP